MIIHNYIHEVLVDISEAQGWNEECQILHLCGFLHFIRRYGPLHELGESALKEKFRAYLQNAADDENDEAVCEACGDSCEYDSEVCLCMKCQAQLS